MELEIRLFATFREFLPEGSSTFSFKGAFDPGTTVAKIMASLNLPPKVPKVIIVKGDLVQADYVPEEGDVISIFPPLGGG
jgi:sulfur-carrier protein